LDIAANDAVAREAALVELMDLNAGAILGRYKRVDAGESGMVIFIESA
jgi:hypothetical protein